VRRYARALDRHGNAFHVGNLLADNSRNGRLNQLLRRDRRSRVATRFVRHIDEL